MAVDLKAVGKRHPLGSVHKLLHGSVARALVADDPRVDVDIVDAETRVALRVVQSVPVFWVDGAIRLNSLWSCIRVEVVFSVEALVPAHGLLELKLNLGQHWLKLK